MPFHVLRFSYLPLARRLAAVAVARRPRGPRARLWVAAAALAAGSLALPGVRLRLAYRDVAAGATWRASSAFGGYPDHGRSDDADGSSLFFHTIEEDEPWLQLDLGSTRRVRGASVRNRSECCEERAAPLELELSLDGVAWSVAARTAHAFDVWTPAFAERPARYVRLRARRKTILHLAGVTVFGR